MGRCYIYWIARLFQSLFSIESFLCHEKCNENSNISIQANVFVKAYCKMMSILCKHYCVECVKALCHHWPKIMALHQICEWWWVCLIHYTPGSTPDSKIHGANMGRTGPRWSPCWPMNFVIWDSAMRWLSKVKQFHSQQCISNHTYQHHMSCFNIQYAVVWDSAWPLFLLYL